MDEKFQHLCQNISRKDKYQLQFPLARKPNKGKHRTGCGP